MTDAGDSRMAAVRLLATALEASDEDLAGTLAERRRNILIVRRR
jgi:hypothetical protein